MEIVSYLSPPPPPHPIKDCVYVDPNRPLPSEVYEYHDQPVEVVDYTISMDDELLSPLFSEKI